MSANPKSNIQNPTSRPPAGHSAAPGGSSDSASQPLEIVAPGQSQDAEMGAQLTAQYQRAIGGIREVLIFGAMMLQVRGVMSTCGHHSTRGPQTKGDGLKAWLEEHAPSVNRATAYRFMDLAEGLRTEFSLAAKTDLAHLLTAPVADLPPADQKRREKIDAFVEGKSQRQLMFEFGFDTKAGKPKGGDLSAHRTGKRRTQDEVDYERKEKRAAESWRWTRASLADEWLAKRLFEGLGDVELANFSDLLDTLRTQVRDLADQRGLKIKTLVTEGWQ